MSNIKFRSKRYCACATIARAQNDLETRQGLAVTPAQMDELAAKGIPISSQSAMSQFQDGTPNPSWDSLPLEETRGIDVAEIWQSSQDSKHKFRDARQSALSKQKSTSQNS